MTAGKNAETAAVKALGNAAASQETILEAALEAFALRGYDGVSVRELNRQIGVSHNLVHHYFGSKDALWRAAIDYGLTRVNDTWRLDDLGPLTDPVEKMKVGLRRFLEVMAPATASSIAMPLPMPRLAPVTTAMQPSSGRESGDAMRSSLRAILCAAAWPRA